MILASVVKTEYIDPTIEAIFLHKYLTKPHWNVASVSRRYITIPLEPILFKAVEEASGNLRLAKSTFIRMLLIRELASTSYLTLGEKKAVQIIGGKGGNRQTPLGFTKDER